MSDRRVHALRRRSPYYLSSLPFVLDAASERASGDPAAVSRAQLYQMIMAAQSAGDVQPVFDLLRELAHRDPSVALLLGRLLWSIGGSEPEGVHWLTAAANGGEAEALHLLGLAHHRGQGAALDLEAARKLHQRAAELGVVEAQFELSLVLDLGLGGPVDRDCARQWEGRASEAGHPRACLNRASRAARAEPPDVGEAIRWYECAAAAGSAEAAARLCRMHLAGQGVARDETAAARWYARAAELGHDWSAERGG